MKFGEWSDFAIIGWMYKLKGITDIYSLSLYALLFRMSQGFEYKIDFQYISSAIFLKKDMILHYLNVFEDCGLIKIRKEGKDLYVLIDLRK